MTDKARIRKLENRLAKAADEQEKRRLRDAIAEQQGMSLTGDAHTRGGGDEPS